MQRCGTVDVVSAILWDDGISERAKAMVAEDKDTSLYELAEVVWGHMSNPGDVPYA